MILRGKIMDNKDEIIHNNAKMLAKVSEISIEEATDMLLKVMETYELEDNELNKIIDKFNEV